MKYKDTKIDETMLYSLFIFADDACQSNNMKNKLLTIEEKYYLAKRGIIESVNAILDSVFDLSPTRHRKLEDSFCHILPCLIAYQFYPDKTRVYFDSTQK